MMHFVEKLVAVRPYRLTLLFNTGEVRAVDLESMLRAKASVCHSAYQSLLDGATFCRARLDPESRTVCWDGLAREITPEGSEQPVPLDLCPDVLYGLSTPLTQECVHPGPGEEHTRADSSSLVLKDEPPPKRPAGVSGG